MNKIINGVASEYDIPMKYENKTMTIEVKNDEMLGRTTDSTLHIELIKLQQENQKLKERYRIRSEAYNKVLLENASLKDKVDLYKEVIEEVRELLDKSVVVPDKEGQEELWWTEKYLCCGDELINKFYEILDKVKGETK